MLLIFKSLSLFFHPIRMWRPAFEANGGPARRAAGSACVPTPDPRLRHA
jgi:hypothetical protein